VRDDVRDDHGRWRGVRRDEDDGPDDAEPSSAFSRRQRKTQTLTRIEKGFFLPSKYVMTTTTRAGAGHRTCHDPECDVLE